MTNKDEKSTHRDSGPLSDRQPGAATDAKGCAHTPGPWAFEIDEDEALVFVVDNLPGRIVVAVVSDQPETEANAQLMAASPDLLAACELVQLHFARNHASGNFQGDDEHEVWAAIRDAIAKAEGRS